MELAINSFNKGLLMDTHPLVLGNDTLSDCLNGTFITMNGNEVILLNDMGNRRIDHAYLPAGYEPVGIKEHGGIIYLALYNPITHRGLVGSFPSPERRIGEENPDLGANFSLKNFCEGTKKFSYQSSDNTLQKVYYLKEDVKLISLSNDTSLHAGDKFTVYSSDVWEWGKNGYLTDFRCKDTINKQFTLSLGVINSLNEFIDITDSLQKFDLNGDIPSNPNEGYFILNGNNTLNEASNDLNFLSNRNAKAINTYAYKLVGPLYLKAKLNHISNFSYNIDYEKLGKDNNKKLILYITGTFLYNCPDPEIEDLFHFYYKTNNNNYTKANSTNASIEYFKELNNLNLYSGEFFKKYEISYTDDNDIIEYFLGVNAFSTKFNNEYNNELNNKLNNEYYLESLSDEGTIEIAKVGSNLCELVGWRFKNNISENKLINTVLTYEFEAYPNKSTKFNNLQIIFKNVNTNNKINLNNLIVSSEIKSGKQNILINWENYENIETRQLYNVEITWNRINSINSIEGEPDSTTEERFFLSTELFNDCYSESSLNYVKDYKIFGKDYKPETGSKEESLRDSFLTIIPEITNNIELTETLTIKKTGKLLLTILEEVSLSLINPDNNEVMFTTMLFISNDSVPTSANSILPELFIVPSGITNLKLKVKYNKRNYIEEGKHFSISVFDIERSSATIDDTIMFEPKNDDIIHLFKFYGYKISLTSSGFIPKFEDGEILGLNGGDKIRIVGIINKANNLSFNISDIKPEEYTLTNTHKLLLDCKKLGLGIKNHDNYPSFINIDVMDGKKYNLIFNKLSPSVIESNITNRIQTKGEVSQEDYKDKEDYKISQCKYNNDKTYNLDINCYHYFKPYSFSNIGQKIGGIYVDINSDLGRLEMFGTRFSDIPNLGIDILFHVEGVFGFTLGIYKQFCTKYNENNLLCTGEWHSTEDDHWVIVILCNQNYQPDGWGENLISIWNKLRDISINNKESIIKYDGSSLLRYFCNSVSQPEGISWDLNGQNVWERGLSQSFEETIVGSPILTSENYIHVFLIDPIGNYLVLLNNNSTHHPGLFAKGFGNDYIEKEITKFLGTDNNGNSYIIPMSDNNILDKILIPSNEKYFYTDTYNYKLNLGINISGNNIHITDRSKESDYLQFTVKPTEEFKKEIVYTIASSDSFKEQIRSILDRSGLSLKRVYISTGEIIDKQYGGISIYKNGELKEVDENCPLKYNAERNLKITTRWSNSSIYAPNCGEFVYPLDSRGTISDRGALGIMYRGIPTLSKEDLTS